MKKLLYIIPTEFMDDSDGVTKKAKQQAKAFSNNGYLVDVISYDNASIIYCQYRENIFSVADKKNSTRTRRRRDMFTYVQKHIEGNNYDVCYTRYPYASFKFISMMRDIKRSGSFNVIEIPTYPIPHTLKKGVKSIPNRLIFMEEKLCKRKLKKYVDQIYSMGEPVKTIMGITNVNISNGIDIDQFPVRSPNAKSNEIRIFYCGSLFNYQGVDRLICGIEQYNQTKKVDDPQIIAEIVGDGPESLYLRGLVKEKRMEDYIYFHGFLSGNKLDQVVNRCDLACSLLASHRANIIHASPLKTKEYLARGIPFVYSYYENGMDTSVKFALKIESSEAPLDMWDILRFYNSYVDLQGELIEEMRLYAKEHYSWESLLKNI